MSKVDVLSPIQSLHPVLHSALTHLDIQLEEELVRYRRMRMGTGQRLSRSYQVSSGAVELPRTYAPVSMPVSDYLGQAHVSTREDEASDLLESVSTSEPAIAPPINPASATVPQNVVPNRGGNLTRSMVADQPDDYLESSEELLRSLAQEESAVQAEKGFMKSLLTPLGLGSMLLLLLSSTMAGYLIMNPTSLTRLFADHSSSEPSATVDASQTPMANPQPNLASENFKDLNLDTLGSLKADSRKTPAIAPTAPSSSKAVSPTAPTLRINTQPTTALPAPAAAPERSAPASTSPQPSAPVKTYAPPAPARTRTASVRSAPIPVYQPPRQSERPSTPAATGSTRPEAYPYKVVTHYDGDRTLDSVRKVVPDAYVRNFSTGARIQLGATGSATEAESRAEELRKQGIAAEVVKK